MNRWELHIRAWGECQRCFLHERRRNICLARGDIPADVVLVGEAPGPSEDIAGEPFVGPAGLMLDNELEPLGMIQQALQMGELPRQDGTGSLRFLFSNLVACIPLDDDGKKFAEPDDLCVEQCKPRLIELIEMARPRLIITVGKLAGEWLVQGERHSHKLPTLPDGSRIPQISITHPAAVLRAPIAARGLMVKRNVVMMKDAFLKLMEE